MPEIEKLENGTFCVTHLSFDDYPKQVTTKFIPLVGTEGGFIGLGECEVHIIVRCLEQLHHVIEEMDEFYSGRIPSDFEWEFETILGIFSQLEELTKGKYDIALCLAEPVNSEPKSVEVKV